MSRQPGRVYESRRNRQTGTTIILVSPGIEAVAEDGWATICDDHGGIIHHDTRELAEQWRSYPAEWCEECQRVWRAKGGKKTLDLPEDHGLSEAE